MQLSEWQLCILALIHEDTVRGGMREVYYPGQVRTFKAVEELQALGLVVMMKSPELTSGYLADVTDEGKEVFKSYPILEVVNVLDDRGWYILAADFINQLSISDLYKFMVHENFFYKVKALARYQELVREG